MKKAWRIVWTAPNLYSNILTDPYWKFLYRSAYRILYVLPIGLQNDLSYSLLNKSESSIFRKLLKILKHFFLNNSTFEGLRRYYLIDSPVPIVVQNGRAPFWHAFH